ncbi:MAG: hypothetical protein JW795_20315 [Chitinivibrionales bacterium]|nr:hypothetical protein [Chitinivibrionales bacterium]
MNQFERTIPDPDEINLLEYVYALLRSKWFILIITVIGYGTGTFLAIKKGPVYIADAVIAPRETDNQTTPNISGLGIFGGMVASQLNMSGSASLDKISLILESRTFHAEIVEKKNLIPIIFKDNWDSTKNSWKAEFIPPKSIISGGIVKSMLKTEIKKNGVMELKVTAKDSLASFLILNAYLDYLDTYIRSNVQKDAKENKDYLESQLITIIDPLVRTKLQELIAKEVEKMMVVSKQAFRVLDTVMVQKSFKEKRLFPLIGAGAAFFLITIIVVLIHAFRSSPKSETDQLLITRIKSELWRLPLFKAK